MRIIRTVIRKKGIKFCAATFVAVTAPAAAMLSAELVPNAVGYMREAARYTAVSGVFTERQNMNNGELILYAPGNTVEQETKPPEEELPVEETAASVSAFFENRNISSYVEDLSVFTNHGGRIYEETFVKNGGEDFINLKNGGQLRNCTDISNETVAKEAEIPSAIQIELNSSQPQVLIMHTHTTESYEPYEKDWFDSEYTSRSADPENGVVAVGQAIANELVAAGIGVIHDGTIHDDIYTGAYARSLATTEEILREYPSIKVVLDIHRDAVEYEDGSRISAVTEIEGRKAAQVMIISAADEGTYGVPDFLENLHFACQLQQSMESSYPTLTRPVLFQYCQYNQQVSTGALLIEVGSHGNSIDQAVYSGELIGKSLARLLKQNAVEEIPVSANVPLYFIDRLR
ncbi:MAG: stage II sporulation protein P, partial [Ruminiclostridium sp.]